MKHLTFAQRIQELRQKIHHDAAHSELHFRQERPVLWWLTLVGPFVVTLAALGIITLIAGKEIAGKLVATSVVSFFAAGKFIILGGGESAQFFSTGELFFLVLYMDVATSFLVVYHTGFMFKIPRVGPAILDLVEHGQMFMATNPWVRRATFLGIILFVAFPLTGTGAIGGALFARLLGMSAAAAIWGIAIGSVLGCGAMYFGAELINRYLSGTYEKIGGIIVILVLVYLLNLRYQSIKKQHLKAMAQVDAEADREDVLEHDPEPEPEPATESKKRNPA